MITITRDGLLTFLNGALGAMTFGMYHQFTTNKIIEINNNYYNKEIASLNKEITLQHKEIALLREEMNKIMNKKYFTFL